MKNKAQAGLEYLMTYGWALVIIVAVIGVLFLVINPGQNKFACNSSDPTKITLQSYDFQWSQKYYTANPYGAAWLAPWGVADSGDVPGKMILINGTGGKITIKELIPFEASNYDSTPTPGCASYREIFPTKIQGVSLYPVDNLVLTNSATWINVQSGQKIEISPVHYYMEVTQKGSINCTAYKNAFTTVSPTFKIIYTNYAGQQKDVNITCNGFPPTPVSLPI